MNVLTGKWEPNDFASKKMVREEKAYLLDTTGNRFNGWDQQYAALQIYKRIHKHCNVPTYYDMNPSLGNWVKEQIRAPSALKEATLMKVKDPKKLTLKKEHKEKLNKIGFNWSYTSWWARRCGPVMSSCNFESVQGSPGPGDGENPVGQSQRTLASLKVLDQTLIAMFVAITRTLVLYQLKCD